MNVKGVLSGVLKNTDKLGGILGFMTGSPGGFADVQSTIDQILQGNVHMPDLQGALSAIASEPYVKNGIMLWILGYVLRELNVPIVSKYGTPLEKFGMAYAAGSVAQKLLWHSTHSNEGSDPNSPTYQNFAKAPATVSYGY